MVNIQRQQYFDKIEQFDSSSDISFEHKLFKDHGTPYATASELINNNIEYENAIAVFFTTLYYTQYAL